MTHKGTYYNSGDKQKTKILDRGEEGDYKQKDYKPKIFFLSLPVSSLFNILVFTFITTIVIELLYESHYM